MRITVRTTSLIKPQIYVYVLKNGEVVFGDNGNNYADITYSTKNARGTGYNGTYQNSGTGTGSNTGGSYTPASSVCGARTKSGGSCKRLVSGGGRCWQHR